MTSKLGGGTDSGSAPATEEAVVTDVLLRNLTEVFDERDRNRRRAAIAELWAADGLFVDPMGRFTGQMLSMGQSRHSMSRLSVTASPP